MLNRDSESTNAPPSLHDVFAFLDLACRITSSQSSRFLVHALRPPKRRSDGTVNRRNSPFTSICATHKRNGTYVPGRVERKGNGVDSPV